MKHVIDLPESVVARLEALAAAEGLTLDGAAQWVLHAGLEVIERAVQDIAWLEGEKIAKDVQR